MTERYLSKNASAPTISYGSGKNEGKIRWVVSHKVTGNTIACSEYVNDNWSGRRFVDGACETIREEQIAHWNV